MRSTGGIAAITDTASWCLDLFAMAEVMLGTGHSLGGHRRAAPPLEGNRTGPPNVGLPLLLPGPYSEPRGPHAWASTAYVDRRARLAF